MRGFFYTAIWICLFIYMQSHAKFKREYKNKRQSVLAMQELFRTQDQVVLLFTLVRVNGKFNSIPICSRVVRSFLTSRD